MNGTHILVSGGVLRARDSLGFVIGVWFALGVGGILLQQVER